MGTEGTELLHSTQRCDLLLFQIRDRAYRVAKHRENKEFAQETAVIKRSLCARSEVYETSKLFFVSLTFILMEDFIVKINKSWALSGQNVS